MNLSTSFNPCSKESQLDRPKKTNPHTPKRKLRKMLIQRDGIWCVICGKPPGDLQIHRVIYGSEGGRYVIDNTVQLCPRCHVPVVHANKKKWQPMLIKYLQTMNKPWMNSVK